MGTRLLIKGLTAVFTGNDTFRNDKNIDIEIENKLITRVEKNIEPENHDVIDGSHCVAIPGLVNTHHHFYQVLTRAIRRMQDSPLFPWLVDHYRVWEGITSEAVYWSSLAAMGELLLTGCTTTTDHHYLFPQNTHSNLIDQQFKASELLGIRFLATRGSMSVGKSGGGLPPDHVTQPEAVILEDCIRLMEAHHDPSPDSMKRLALAPCSPFSVSETLMKQTAELARKHNLRLHTHLAETLDEENYCIRSFGCRPVQLMQNLDWLGPDVWFAHCVHMNEAEINLFAETNTGVAHCPSSNMRLGSGIAPVRELLNAGAPVGIAVDGSASNDSSDMLGEIRQALLLQRVTKGADALTVDDALRLGTTGGAKVLGFDNCGIIKPGALADIALFDINSLDYTGVHDPVGGLLLTGDSHRAKHVIVNGIQRVSNGKLLGMDEQEIMQHGNELARNLVKTASERTKIDYSVQKR